MTLIWDVPHAQPLLPISHKPRQNWAEDGTAQIKVNPTQVLQQMPTFRKLNSEDFSYLGVDDEDVALVDAVVLVQDVEEDVEQRAAARLRGRF